MQAVKAQDYGIEYVAARSVASTVTASAFFALTRKTGSSFRPPRQDDVVGKELKLKLHAKMKFRLKTRFRREAEIPHAPSQTFPGSWMPFKDNSAAKTIFARQGETKFVRPSRRNSVARSSAAKTEIGPDDEIRPQRRNWV